MTASGFAERYQRPTLGEKAAAGHSPSHLVEASALQKSDPRRPRTLDFSGGCYASSAFTTSVFSTPVSRMSRPWYL